MHISRLSAKMSRFAIAGAAVMCLGACSAILGLTDPATDNSIDGGEAGAGDGGGGPGDGASEGTVRCGDTSGDSKNCGSCNHDCLGGECKAGVCQPVLMVDDPSKIAPLFMIKNGTDLYFSDILPAAGVSNIAKIPMSATADGGTSYTILADFTLPDGGNTYSSYPYQLSIAGTNLYISVTTNVYLGSDYFGGILKCPITGCTDTTNITVPNVDSSTVFSNGSFVVYDGAHHGATDYVFMSDPALDSASATMVDIGVVSDVDYMGQAVIDTGVAYVSSTKGIFAMNPGDSTATPLLTSEADRIATTGNYVYFVSELTSNPTIGAVSKLGIDAGAPLVLGGGTPFLQFPSSIAVDSAFLYVCDEGDFNDSSSGKLIRCPIAGCGTNNADAVILSAGSNPRVVFDDVDAIYWGERGGKIWRLAK